MVHFSKLYLLLGTFVSFSWGAETNVGDEARGIANGSLVRSREDAQFVENGLSTTSATQESSEARTTISKSPTPYFFDERASSPSSVSEKSPNVFPLQFGGTLSACDLSVSTVSQSQSGLSHGDSISATVASTSLWQVHSPGDCDDRAKCHDTDTVVNYKELRGRYAGSYHAPDIFDATVSACVDNNAVSWGGSLRDTFLNHSVSTSGGNELCYSNGGVYEAFESGHPF